MRATGFAHKLLPNKYGDGEAYHDESRELATGTGYYCVEYWGSAEENEVQMILQQIVGSSLDSHHCTALLAELRNKLVAASSGWVDRFAIGQGILVLHKLLADINGESYEAMDFIEREFIIVQCFAILYEKSTVAQQLVAEEAGEAIMKSLLRSLLSPVEETRILASKTIEGIKSSPGSNSRVLYTVNLTRSSRRFVPTSLEHVN